MARIKFTTDSAADIPAALREELDIQVLPFPIAMGDKEYEDGFDFTAQEFYSMLLDAPQIRTHAQLTFYVFTQLFEEAWEAGYTDLIHTSINSKGSATCQNAFQAREEFYEEHSTAKTNGGVLALCSDRKFLSCGELLKKGYPFINLFCVSICVFCIFFANY